MPETPESPPERWPDPDWKASPDSGDTSPLVTAADPVVLPRAVPYPDLQIPSRAPSWKWPVLLFLFTCVTTFYRGGMEFQWEVVQDPATSQWVEVNSLANFLWGGAAYALCVMTVLLAHEMGHYVQTRRYGVAASPPYFIPMPFSPFGTMGAVIIQRGNNADRRQMFDIAISGPLAGLLIAVPLAIWGTLTSPILPRVEETNGTMVGIPMIMRWMILHLRGAPPAGSTVYLNPAMFAGWVGFFITALNLLPIGQLDGGHLLYCLVPKWARWLAGQIYSSLLIVTIWGGLFLNQNLLAWAPILFLLWYMGIRHPPTADDTVPLGPVRIILGWLTLAFIIVGFTPVPFG